MNMRILIKCSFSFTWILCWNRLISAESHLYSRRIHNQAVKLAQTVQEAQKSVDYDAKEDWESKYEILDQLHSLEKDDWPVLQGIYKKVGEQSSLGRKIRIIFERIGIVQTFYKLFVSHFRNPAKFSREKRRKFVDEMTLPFTDFRNATDYVFSEFSSLTKTNLTEITKVHYQDHEFCNGTQTPQQLLYQFYEVVALSDAKAAMIRLYAYDIKEKLENSIYENLKRDTRVSLWQRLDKISETVRDEISEASREISTCPILNPGDALKLQVFQKYLVHQSDMANMWRATFDSCPDFKQVKSECDSVSCLEHAGHKVCRGKLDHCEAIRNRIDVCFSPPYSNRRYNWIKTDENQLYGPTSTDCEKIRTFEYGLFSKFCFCVCEEDQMNIDRHFSLADVTSDIEDNKVVTGARLVKRSHVFYIQIQQGILGENGKIGNTPEWKEVDEVSLSSSNSSNLRDLVFTVTHNQNKFRLEELSAKRSEVLTGLRFARFDNELVLQIRKTQFNVFTGKLETRGTSWYHPYLESSEREDADNFGNAGSLQTSLISPPTDNCEPHVRFRTSNMRVDLGQNTIPFLDPQPIVSEPPIPLNGAGFWLRDENETAETLTLKLITYDLTTLV